MKTLLFCLLGFFAITSASAQTHTIPFASTGNVIELEVANTSDAAIADMDVTVDAPGWVIYRVEQGVAQLEGAESQAVRVQFDVAPDAPVGEVATIGFLVKGAGKNLASKDIHIEVGAPHATELQVGYPNPFSGSTTIPFLLSEPGAVRLSVYDMLGRRVALLVDDDRAAGLHSAVWTVGGHGSGVYLTRLDVATESGQVVEHGRVTLRR